jgi:hypothetical protein
MMVDVFLIYQRNISFNLVIFKDKKGQITQGLPGVLTIFTGSCADTDCHIGFLWM